MVKFLETLQRLTAEARFIRPGISASSLARRGAIFGRPMMAHPRFLSAALGLTLVASLGCGSSEASRRKDEQAELMRTWNDPHHARIQAASEPKEDSSSEMSVSGDEGTLNAADVEGAIDQHRGELLDCYGLGRRAS